MQTEGGAAVQVRPAVGGRSLTSRATLNGFASGLDYGTRALVELLVSPLVVGGVGAAAYGAWRVLWQWSSYVWGASGRSAQALQFAIAHKQWTAEDAEKRQLVGAAVLVWLLFLPLMLVAGLAGVWLAPVLLDVPSEQVTPLRLAAAILAVDAMVMTLVTLPRSSLVGENLGYTRMGASAVLVAVGGGLLALAVQLDLGLPGLAGATLLTTLLTGVVFAVITRRRLSWFGIARPSRALARWFLGLSVWFLGWKLVLELMIASDVLVLAAFAPLTAVAAFALSKWVADSMAQVLSILVQATIPGIGAYLGSGALDVAARLRGEVMSLVWVAGSGIGTTVLVWNGTFVGLWVGEHLYAGRTTTLLVVVLAFQLALIRTDTFIIDVALRPRVKVLAGGLAALLSIGLAAMAAGPLDGGVVGLCLGLVTGRAVLGVVAPVAAGRFLGVPLRRQSGRVLRPALATSALFGTGYWLAGENAVDSWFLLVTGVAGTVVVASAVAFVLGLSPLQRARLARRTRILLRRGEASAR